MTATPEMIAAAWAAWHARHGGKLGPGPAFAEAIADALLVAPSTFAAGYSAALRDAAGAAREPTTIGGPGLEFVQGFASAQQRIATAIEALPVKEG